MSESDNPTPIKQVPAHWKRKRSNMRKNSIDYKKKLSEEEKQWLREFDYAQEHAVSTPLICLPPEMRTEILGELCVAKTEITTVDYDVQQAEIREFRQSPYQAGDYAFHQHTAIDASTIEDTILDMIEAKTSYDGKPSAFDVEMKKQARGRPVLPASQRKPKNPPRKRIRG